MFQESQEKELEVSYIKELSEIYEKLKDEKVLALDTETTGLDPIKHYPIMLQFGTEKDQYVIDIRGEDLTPLLPLFSNDILFVGHNLKFDYNMLKNKGIVFNKLYDTMLAEMCLENGKYDRATIKKNKPFALKTLALKYLNEDVGKETREEFVSWGSTPFTYRQIVYGAKDVIFPLKIRKHQEILIERYELEKAVALENKVCLTLGDIEYNGIYLDSKRWIDVNEKSKKELKKIYSELDKLVIEKDSSFYNASVQLDLFSNILEDKYRRLTNINWDSALQVISILVNTFGIKPYDKDGKISGGAKALELLPEKPPIVEKLLEFRKKQKIVNTFGTSFLSKFRYEDGRIRTSFNSMVDTGRVSSSKPNMQQIPGNKDFRSCFLATKGKVLITADYSNQEGRIMADKSNDEAYIDFFNNGDGDAHSFIARTLFSAAEGKPVDVKNDKSHPNYHLRHKGKVLNFFISFGGSAFTLSKTLRISTDEAQYLIDNFYKGFPGLKKMFDSSGKEALETGKIRTNDVTKRIRWMRGWRELQILKQKGFKNLTQEERKTMGGLQGQIKRRGQNTPIQGSAGDMTKTALILIREKLIKNHILPFKDAAIKIVNVVHDK